MDQRERRRRHLREEEQESAKKKFLEAEEEEASISVTPHPEDEYKDFENYEEASFEELQEETTEIEPPSRRAALVFFSLILLALFCGLLYFTLQKSQVSIYDAEKEATNDIKVFRDSVLQNDPVACQYLAASLQARIEKNSSCLEWVNKQEDLYKEPLEVSVSGNKGQAENSEITLLLEKEDGTWLVSNADFLPDELETIETNTTEVCQRWFDESTILLVCDPAQLTSEGLPLNGPTSQIKVYPANRTKTEKTGIAKINSTLATSGQPPQGFQSGETLVLKGPLSSQAHVFLLVNSDNGVNPFVIQNLGLYSNNEASIYINNPQTITYNAPDGSENTLKPESLEEFLSF